MNCPDESTLLSFIDGELDGRGEKTLHEHLDTCEACRGLVSELSRSAFSETPDASDEALLVTATQDTKGGGDPAELLPPGTMVGRYEIRSAIGAGGMGVVYAAYDPRLSRMVAVKLVRNEGSEEELEGTRNERLLREARTLARLSHPNVVSIYDAGQLGNQVFIAMELVSGRTLAEWLATRRRNWREVLTVFLQAGRGLSAAHEAGIVHRDFKPGNVIVGENSEIKVLDFGLARPDAPMRFEPRSQPRQDASTTSDLTRPGEVIGTPAYMAPEQHAGGAADPRTDQFSYCVAFYEALYGERPFTGSTLSQVATAIEAARVRPVPVGSDVPGWLRRDLLRGLSADPSQRYPSMKALLIVLGRDRGATVRRALIVAAMAACIVAGLLIYRAAEEPRGARCEGAARHLRGAWDDTRRAEVRRRFVDNAKPFGTEVYRRTRSVLDRYAAGWATQHREACLANVRGEQSDSLLDLRMWCLSQQLREVRALTKLFARADRQIVRRAVQAVSALPRLSNCSDVRRLRAGGKPPSPAKRAAVEQLHEELAMLRALFFSGKYPSGLEQAREVLKRARATGDRAVIAEALLVMGRLLDKSGKSKEAEAPLEEAIWMAHASKADRVAVEASALLVYVSGYRRARFEVAERWNRYARAALDRLGGDTLLEADLNTYLGSMRYEQGRYPLARKAFEHSLALRKKSLSGAHPMVAEAHSGLGVVLWSEGRYEEALRQHRRSEEIWRQALGAQHPDVAIAYNNQALVYWKQGKLAESLRYHRRSVELRERSLGPNHKDLANSLSNTGIVLRRLGRLKEALRYQQRALRIRRKVLGDKHPDVALSLNNLASVLRSLGRYKEALLRHERALELRRAVLGDNHPELAIYFINAAEALLKLNRPSAALERGRKAWRLQDRGLPPGHSDRARSLWVVGESLLRLGRFAEALVPLKRAVKRHAKKLGDRPLLAKLHFGLARACWARDQTRVQTRQHLLTARRILQRPGRRRPPGLAPIDKWMKEKGIAP